MNAIDLTVRGLATYRLTRLVTRDQATANLREAIWKRNATAGYLVSCDWCTSIYAASALEISRTIAPKTTRAVETVLALSAVAGMLAAREDN